MKDKSFDPTWNQWKRTEKVNTDILGFQVKITYSKSVCGKYISVTSLTFEYLSNRMVKEMITADEGYLEYLNIALEKSFDKELADDVELHNCFGHQDEFIPKIEVIA